MGRRIFSRVCLAAWCFGWVGCGGQQSVDQDRAIHESLQLLREFSALAATITDESSARQAAGRFQELNRRRQQTQSAFARLRQGFSIADEARLNKKFGGDLNAEATRIKFELSRLADLPGVANVLGFKDASEAALAAAQGSTLVSDAASSGNESAVSKPVNLLVTLTNGRASRVASGSKVNFRCSYSLLPGAKLPSNMRYVWVINATSGEVIELDVVGDELLFQGNLNGLMDIGSVKGPFTCHLELRSAEDAPSKITIISNAIDCIEELLARDQKPEGPGPPARPPVRISSGLEYRTPNDLHRELIAKYGKENVLRINLLSKPNQNKEFDKHVTSLFPEATERIGVGFGSINGRQRIYQGVNFYVPVPGNLRTLARQIQWGTITRIDEGTRTIEVVYNSIKWGALQRKLNQR